MKRDYEADARKVLSVLGQGKENAVSRERLRELFGGKDRDMRRAVAYAKLKFNVSICNDQDGKGYYIGTSLDELLRQYYQAEARGRKILATLKSLRRDIEALRNSNQLKFETEKQLEEIIKA